MGGLGLPETAKEPLFERHYSADFGADDLELACESIHNDGVSGVRVDDLEPAQPSDKEHERNDDGELGVLT